MGDKYPVPQFLASHMLTLGIGGGTGTGLVWPWHQNTPFIHQHIIILASSIIISRQSKYQIRYHGVANKTYGVYRPSSHYIHAHSKGYTHIPFIQAWGKIPELDENSEVKLTHRTSPCLTGTGTVLLWTWHIHAPFIQQHSLNLASISSRSRQSKSQNRWCGTAATGGNKHEHATYPQRRYVCAFWSPECVACPIMRCWGSSNPYSNLGSGYSSPRDD